MRCPTLHAPGDPARFLHNVNALHLLPLFLLANAALAEPPIESEVCVYGGTPAGVMAAVAAARQGHSVALVDINAHTGGMVSGGLVATDMGDRKTVGGLAGQRRRVPFSQP